MPDPAARPPAAEGALEKFKRAVETSEEERWYVDARLDHMTPEEGRVVLDLALQAARPAPPRESEHRPCDLPQCDHRCNACGGLWPCEGAPRTGKDAAWFDPDGWMGAPRHAPAPCGPPRDGPTEAERAARALLEGLLREALEGLDALTDDSRDPAVRKLLRRIRAALVAR